MRRSERQENATQDIKIYPSTHRLIGELRVKLYEREGKPIKQSDAVDYAVRRALEGFQEG